MKDRESPEEIYPSEYEYLRMEIMRWIYTKEARAMSGSLAARDRAVSGRLKRDRRT